MTTKFFKVGGAVRDELMGLKPKDVDYAVECESFAAMREEILKRGGKIFVETPQFFTIRAMMPKPFGAADFVLCRKDSATGDGRRPDFVTPGTIFDDLARRDFTINAMARSCQTEELIDFLGGAKDIREKVIRCVGNPIVRFNEDKLRIFRAIRFSITKNFEIESETARAMAQYAVDDFEGVATERIREELLRCFVHDTFLTIDLICNEFPKLGFLVKSRGIWLKPTVEGK